MSRARGLVTRWAPLALMVACGHRGGLVVTADTAQLEPLLVVSELQRSVAFYTDVLGALVEVRWDTYARLSLDGRRLHLTTPGPPTPDKPDVSLVAPAPSSAVSAALVLTVPDCRRAHARLVARGARFLTPPAEPPWGGEVRAFLRDPDGHLIELSERR